MPFNTALSNPLAACLVPKDTADAIAAAGAPLLRFVLPAPRIAALPESLRNCISGCAVISITISSRCRND